MIKVQDAIDHLYDLAVKQGRVQSPSRLKVLAEFCIQELALRGLPGALPEREVPGGGRAKSWDVTWTYDGKVRLAISLKSLLKNLPGTVPNRLDDLMGEVANAQLYSPEIVLGYVMVLDRSGDAYSASHGCTWCELMRKRLDSLAGRKPPSWTIGTIEAFVLAEVDFSQRATLLSPPDDFSAFFDTLVEQVRHRNPNAIAPTGVSPSAGGQE